MRGDASRSRLLSGALERALGDFALVQSEQAYKAPTVESGKKVAIVGSGPAGLSAAYYLRRAGHSVTVYEKLAEAGGMLLYTIPGYRLPKDVVRKQVNALKGMGIDFICDTGMAGASRRTTFGPASTRFSSQQGPGGRGRRR